MKFKVSTKEAKVITERGGIIKLLISPQHVEAKNFILGVSTLNSGETVENHVHDYSDEAFYVISGMGKIKIANNDWLDFEEGDAVFVPKGSAHTITNTGTIEMHVVFTASPLAPTPAIGHRIINPEGVSNEKLN